MKKNLFLTLLIAAALSGAACRRGGDEAAGDKKPQEIVLGPADVAVVVHGPIQTGPELSGTLKASREAAIRAQIGASVLETLVEPGEPVERGQLLARLDTASLRDARTSAQAAVTTARSSLALAQREEERQRTLEQAGAVAQRNVETAHQQAVAAGASLAQARAQLASVEEQLANTRVTAPFAGIVSERPVSAGDVVQPGTALYTVVDPASLQLEASVPAERIASLHVGAPVDFTVNGFPGRTFRGRISRVNPTADPSTRQVRVYAELPNTGGNTGGNTGSSLVSGLFAEGRVASQARTGLTVPAAAIDRRMMTPAVLRVRAGSGEAPATVERVQVQLGLIDEREQRVEIVRGVQAGDIVLQGAAQELALGTPVELTPAARQEAEKLAQKL